MTDLVDASANRDGAAAVATSLGRALIFPFLVVATSALIVSGAVLASSVEFDPSWLPSLVGAVIGLILAWVAIRAIVRFRYRYSGVSSSVREIRLDRDEVVFLTGASRRELEKWLEGADERVLFWEDSVKFHRRGELPLNAVITLKALRELDLSGTDPRQASSFLVHLSTTPAWTARIRTLEAEIEPLLHSWFDSTSTKLSLAFEIRQPRSQFDSALVAYLDTIARLTRDLESQQRLYRTPDFESMNEFGERVVAIRDRVRLSARPRAAAH